MPVAASPILTCASAAEYCALMTSFWLRKASTLVGEALLVLDQLLLLGCEAGDLLVETLELLLRERLALERGAGEILAAGAERLACLARRASTTSCSSFCVCISRRFFAVTTSAMPRLTFWSSSSCFS